MVERQGARRIVRGGNRQDKFTLTQDDPVQLQFSVQEGSNIELQLELAKQEQRAVGGFAPNSDLIGNHSTAQVQPQADKFQGDAVLAQSVNERAFCKIRQTHEVQPQDGTDAGQKKQPHDDSAYPETRAPFDPKTGLVTHAAKRSLKRG
jgi:hypothetical protein